MRGPGIDDIVGCVLRNRCRLLVFVAFFGYCVAVLLFAGTALGGQFWSRIYQIRVWKEISIAVLSVAKRLYRYLTFWTSHAAPQNTMKNSEHLTTSVHLSYTHDPRRTNILMIIQVGPERQASRQCGIGSNHLCHKGKGLAGDPQQDAAD
jgi:hypothetical protein